MSEQTGALRASLLRSAKDVRTDRGELIVTSLERYYRRQIEDLEDANKILGLSVRERLDMSPSNAQSLTFDFNEAKVKKFFDEDLKAGLEERDNDIKLEVLRRKYFFLFGREPRRGEIVDPETETVEQ